MSKLPANPYIADEDRRRAYEQMVLSVIKLYSITYHTDADLTDNYALLALQHGEALTGDSMTAFYAAVWEAAHFMNTVAGPNVADVSFELGESGCDHETCKVSNAAEATLIEAAVRGDGDAVQGICKAVVAEARKNELGLQQLEDPEVALYVLFSGSLRRFLSVVRPDPEG